jgi:hypothetical protein
MTPGSGGSLTFPVPFLPAPPPTQSRSRRVTQRRNLSVNRISVANNVINSLNQLCSPNAASHSCSNLPSVSQKTVQDVCLSNTALFFSRLSDEKSGGVKAGLLCSPNSFSSAYFQPTTAQWIRAKDVSLPAVAATVDLLQCLPDELKLLYSAPNPAILLPEPSGGWPDMPCAHLVEHSEYLQLLRRMNDCGMLEFSTERPFVINGLFAVAKEGDEQRIIVDMRRSNPRFSVPPDPLLPSPAYFADLVVPASVQMSVGKSDVGDYYHSFKAPVWMRKYFGLPPVRAGELGLSGFDPDTLVYPMLITLPMGFSHAVFLAQAAHVHLAASDPAALPDELITGTSDLRLDRVRLVIYIDDVVFAGPNRQAVSARMQAYLLYMRSRGFYFKAKKIVEACDRVDALGLDLDGARRTIALSPRKMLTLVADTEMLIASGSCSGKVLSRLVGRWVWAMLVRRPALSIWSAVYRFISVAGDRVFSLWPSVQRELRIAAGLAPLLIARLDSPFAPRVVASDSSLSGFGVSAARVPPSVAEELALSTIPRPVIHPELCAAVQTAPWYDVFSAPWQRAEHINSLEMRAATSAIRWVSSLSSSSFSKLLFFTDSSAVLGSVAKGRSSAFSLLSPLRVFSVYCLAFAISVYPRWLPSSLNPSDASSRQYGCQ